MKSVDNSTYKTSLVIGAPVVKQVLWYFTNALIFKTSWFPVSSLKVFLLRLFGANLGKGITIKPGVNIKFPWKLFIGDHSWLGESVWIDNLAPVIIGKSVTISQGALILTGSHDHTKVTFDFIANPVVLEDGVWVGAKAVVYGGVICKSHSILGILSVAERDLMAYTIYKGNPAIPILGRALF